MDCNITANVSAPWLNIPDSNSDIRIWFIRPNCQSLTDLPLEHDWWCHDRFRQLAWSPILLARNLTSKSFGVAKISKSARPFCRCLRRAGWSSSSQTFPSRDSSSRQDLCDRFAHLSVCHCQKSEKNWNFMKDFEKQKKLNT